MAYIKVKWRKDVSRNRELSAREYEKYLLKERGTELVVNCHNCPEGKAINQFEMTQAFHGKNKARSGENVNVAFEVIYSFCPEESKILSAEDVNLMGVELAKRYFPDHEFFVVTHTDTNKTHNHILVNPVNEKTGQRDITNKKKHLYNLRTLSDEIVKERGLSIIRETDKSRNQRLPQKVREIQRRGGKSYRLDLFQKADFARSYATSFDEYVGLLNELSVKVAITEKTISYYYKGHEKGIRGQKLGANYDKSGLIEKFKKNDELFLKKTHVRWKIREDISRFQNGKREPLEISESQLFIGANAQKSYEKNYESYTKSDRRFNKTPLPSNEALRDSIIPVSEIRRASNSDILEYCKKHKIPLVVNKKGESLLKGRKHIVISGSRWVNTKNKTVGSLIEFVSLHDDISFLGAISKITGNKNLLLLEEHFGGVKRPYKSFYIPKIARERPEMAKEKLMQFFKYHGINQRLSDDLFKQKRVQVDKKGGIWFYTDEDQKEAVQYTPDSDKSYKAKHYGREGFPLIQPHTNGSRVTVYTDFLGFLKAGGKRTFTGRLKSTLVLRGLDARAFHIFLAANPNIKSLDFVEPENKEQQLEHLDFINRQKRKLESFGISVRAISMEKAVKKERGLSLEF